MTNSLQLYTATIRKGLRDRKEAQDAAAARREIIRAGWANLEQALRRSTGIDDLVVSPWVETDRERMPITGDLVRLYFPALLEVVGDIPQIIISIQAVISSRTGEVVTAKPDRYWYTADRMVPSPDLMSALFNALDVPREVEELPASEIRNNYRPVGLQI